MAMTMGRAGREAGFIVRSILVDAVGKAITNSCIRSAYSKYVNWIAAAAMLDSVKIFQNFMYLHIIRKTNDGNLHVRAGCLGRRRPQMGLINGVDLGDASKAREICRPPGRQDQRRPALRPEGSRGVVWARSSVRRRKALPTGRSAKQSRSDRDLRYRVGRGARCRRLLRSLTELPSPPIPATTQIGTYIDTGVHSCFCGGPDGDLSCEN
jgi:hypothetical protein